jgi:ribosomal protein S27AE
VVNLPRKLNRAWRMLDARAVRMLAGRCPNCGVTVFTRLADTEIAVRCVRCHASGIHLSIMTVLNELFPDMRGLSVYEMSSRSSSPS